MGDWKTAYNSEKSRRLKAEKALKEQRAAKEEARRQLESERQRVKRYKSLMRDWDSSLQRKFNDINELMNRIMITKKQIYKQCYG
jgi:predicted  nucleic acid-binding Zn-ribbon protein